MGVMKLGRGILLAAATVVAGCATTSPPPQHPNRMGAAIGPPVAGPLVVGSDPSITGMAASVGQVVFAGGGQSAWVKSGPNATDWQAFPGSSGTVTTQAPITGNGSSGSPITTSLVGVSPGTSVTAASDQQALSFTGLNGLTAGGYEINGTWVAGTGGDTNLILQINGVTTGYSTSGVYSNATAAQSDLNGSQQGLGTGTGTTIGCDVARGGFTGRNQVDFVVRLIQNATTGNWTARMHSSAYNSSTSAQQAAFDLTCRGTGTITRVDLVTLNGSSTGMKTGSTGSIRPLWWTQ